jgi:hypothetical protein
MNKILNNLSMVAGRNLDYVYRARSAGRCDSGSWESGELFLLVAVFPFFSPEKYD